MLQTFLCSYCIYTAGTIFHQIVYCSNKLIENEQHFIGKRRIYCKETICIQTLMKNQYLVHQLSLYNVTVVNDERFTSSVHKVLVCIWGLLYSLGIVGAVVVVISNIWVYVWKLFHCQFHACFTSATC